MLIQISSILSIIHPEPLLEKNSTLCFNNTYAVARLNLLFVTVIGSELQSIIYHKY